jgi:hypothetical protein
VLRGSAIYIYDNKENCAKLKAEPHSAQEIVELTDTIMQTFEHRANDSGRRLMSKKGEKRERCFSLEYQDDSTPQVCFSTESDEDYRDWMKRICEAARPTTVQAVTREQYYDTLGLDPVRTTS